MTSLDDREHVEGPRSDTPGRTHPLDDYRRGEFVRWARDVKIWASRDWMIAGRVPDGRICIRTKTDLGEIGGVLAPESELEAA